MTRLGQKFKGTSGVTMTVIAAALLLWAVIAGSRPAAPPPTIDGEYKVRVAGYGSGGGTCIVQAKRVDFNCLITADSGGESQKFRVLQLPLDGYRFRGNGKLDGVEVRVTGRIDPPDADAPAPRVSATFIAADGRSGRIVGTHE